MSLVGAFSFFILLASWPAGIHGRGYSKPKKASPPTSYRPIVVYSDRIYCLNENTHKEVPCLQHDNKKTTLVLAIAGPILAALLLALGVCMYIRKRRHARHSSQDANTLGTYIEIKDETSSSVQEQAKPLWYKHPTAHVFTLSLVVGLPFSLFTLLIFSLTPRYDPFPIALICKSAVEGWAVLLLFYVIMIPWTWRSNGWAKLISKESRRITVCWVWIWTYWFASPLLGTTIAETGGVSASNMILPTWVYTLLTIAAATLLAVYAAVVGKWYAQGSGEEVD